MTCLWSHLDTAKFLGAARAVDVAQRACGCCRPCLSPIFIPPQPASSKHSDDDAITPRRPKYHRPSASTPPPPRSHTPHTPPPSPLHPLVLVSLRPACILRHALSQGRACAFLPRLLPRIYVRRGHTDPLPCPSRQQPRRPLNAFATGHTAKQIACRRFPHTL